MFSKALVLTTLFFLAAQTSAQASPAEPSIECKLKADPTSTVVLGVDESGGDADVILFAIYGPNQKTYGGSALLPHFTLSKQVRVGSVIVRLGDDAESDTAENVNGALFAISRIGRTHQFEGYVALHRNGTAVLPIKCLVK